MSPPPPADAGAPGYLGINNPQSIGAQPILDLLSAFKELNTIVNIEQLLLLTRTLIENLRPCRTLADEFQVFFTTLSKLDSVNAFA